MEVCIYPPVGRPPRWESEHDQGSTIENAGSSEKQIARRKIVIMIDGGNEKNET